MSAVERETRQSILDAAAELMGERGYRATTTRAIAERAGVNEVTIFRQFGNKKGLLQALVEDWAETVAGFAVAELAAPDDTRGTLEALAAMEVRQARQFGAPAMRLAFDARSEPDVMEVMGAGPESNLEGLTGYLAARQEAGDLRPDLHPRVMAEAFFALTSTIVMSRLLLGDRLGGFGPETDEATRQMLEIYLAGVGVKRARSGTKPPRS
jgi:AcrR family transcriptional regulator